MISKRPFHKTNLKYLLLLLCTVSAFDTPVHADVIFDNSDMPQFTTIRSGDGIAAYLQMAGSDVTINQIAVDAAPSTNGQLKFIIFSDVAYPGNNAGSILLTNTVNVGPSSTLTYLYSDPISFTLQGGYYYDIGAIFSGGNITYAYDLLGNTSSGITSIASNQNIGQFANPILLGHALGDADIKLYSASTTVVPEPAAGTLFACGLILFGIIQASYRQSTSERYFAERTSANNRSSAPTAAAKAKVSPSARADLV